MMMKTGAVLVGALSQAIAADTKAFTFTLSYDTNNSQFSAPLYFGTPLAQQDDWETNPSQYYLVTTLGWTATTTKNDTKCRACAKAEYEPTESSSFYGNSTAGF